MRLLPPLLACVASVALAAPALPARAQTPAPPAGPPPAAADAPAPTPPPIEVRDPLLEAVPPPARIVANWREALKLITSRSTELEIALSEVERAEGLRRQALAGALPSLTATGSVTHHLITGERTIVTGTDAAGNPIAETAEVPTTPTAVAQLTAALPVLAPRVWYGIGTANRVIEAAKLRTTDARRTIALTVADAIVAVVTAERVAEVNRVGLRSALERLELTERRLRLGSGTKLDVVRAEQDATLARATLIRGDESLRTAREALGIALGSNEAFGVVENVSIDDIEQTVKETCGQGKPEQRADVLAAQAEVEIAERGVTDAKLAYSPTAQVSTTLSYASEEQANSEHYAWSIQGVLTIPIWDGGSRYGETRAAKATVRQQRARLAATGRVASVESTQAFRAVGVAEQARDQAERGRALAAETARLSQVAFAAGTATSFELVDAGRTLRQAELDLAVREFELVRARIAALLATANCTY